MNNKDTAAELHFEDGHKMRLRIPTPSGTPPWFLVDQRGRYFYRVGWTEDGAEVVRVYRQQHPAIIKTGAAWPT